MVPEPAAGEGRPAWQMLVFVGIVTVAASVILAFVGMTASCLFTGALDWRFVAIGVVLALVMALGMAVAQYWHIRAVTPLYLLSTTLMGAMLYAMLASLAALPFIVLFLIFDADDAAWMLLRWAFVCSVLLPVAWGLMAGRLLVVRRERVSMASEGFRAVLVSDLHLGLLSGKRRLKAISRIVKREKSDLLVVAGDFLDTEPRFLKRFEKEAASLFASVPTYAVIGNHELYHDLPESVAWMRRMGARVLRNEAAAGPKGIAIGGVDDPQAFSSPESHREAVENLVKGGVKVLVSHQPLHFGGLSRSGLLMLCGHTHYGQVWPMDWITRRIYKDGDRGLVSMNGSHMVVSAGAGTWGPPMRVGSLSEVVVIDVVSG